MKTKIIALLLLYIPILTMGQTKSVEKLINGKPCDTCLVKSHMYFSNILPYVFIGTYTNSTRLFPEKEKFDESLGKMNSTSKLSELFQSHQHIIIDSVFNLVYLTELDRKPDFFSTKNFDYKKVEIKIEKNNKILMNWKILDQLPSIDGFKINRYKYDNINKKDIYDSYTSTHATGDIKLAYNDLVIITLRNLNTKEIIQRINVKRILDKPKHFDYYQTSVNSAKFKESLQSFLNDPISTEYVRRNDTTNSFELTRNNIGVLLFNALDDGEEIEYRLDKTLPWKSFIKTDGSAFENKFIILDNEDVPPGTTKTLYLRYKNQPETEIPITIRGVEDFKQTSVFKILAGFMLASLLFGIWYYFNRRRTKKKLQQLNQKNKDIETQLSLLSGQLNPHFLFNSLNAIQGTIMNNDSQTANAHISEIADFMRRVMDDGKKDFISLEEELNLEEGYLKLENKRKSFSYSTTIEPSINITEIEFPPLILQPTLENSIRHAFTSDVEDPKLAIEIDRNDKDLIVKIIDNGSYWDTATLKEEQGLSLTRKRIAVYNEKLSPIKISMNITYDSGTITTFTLNNWLT